MWSSEPAWLAVARRRRLLSGVGLAALLAGCGFQLRGSAKLTFTRIVLQGFAARSPLAAELRRELAKQVQVLDAPVPGAVILQALEDRRDRSVVASTSAALVRDLQLRLSLRFRAQTSAGRELIAPTELLVKRELSYSETAALAKEAEEAGLYRDMQADVVAQVLRRLAAVQL